MLPTGKIILTNQIENFNCRMSPTGSGIKSGDRSRAGGRAEPCQCAEQWAVGERHQRHHLFFASHFPSPGIGK